MVNSIDITERMKIYRETVRHLWNTAYCHLVPELGPGETQDVFSAVEQVLFKTLVLLEVHPLTSDYQWNWEASRILIEPKHPEEVGVLLNRSNDARTSGYWDATPNRLVCNQNVLAFVEFFDWEDILWRDLQYVMVRIVGTTQDPSLLHRTALVEFGAIERFMRSEQGTADNAKGGRVGRS